MINDQYACNQIKSNSLRAYNQLDIPILLMVIYIFFSQFKLISASSANEIILYILICLAPVCFFVKMIKYKKNDTIIWFIVFDILLLMGSVGSVDVKSSLISTCYRFGAMIILFYLISDSDRSLKAIKYVIICASIHLSFVFIHLLFPSFMSAIANIYFDELSLDSWHRLSSAGYSIGLTRQAGFTTIFISPVCAYYYSKINNTRGDTVKNILMLCFAAAGIILTAKRSSFGAIFFAIAICMVISAFDKKSKKIRLVFISCSLIFAVFFVLMNTGMGQLLLLKFNVYDVFGGSGRDALWSTAISYWQKSPWFGAGTNYFALANDISTHNSYLQLLCENGIIGLAAFLFFVISMFIKSLRVHLSLEINAPERIYTYMSIYFQAYYLAYAFFESAYANNTMFILYIVMSSYPISLFNRYREKKYGE